MKVTKETGRRTQVMIMPLWFSNLVSWSAQVALLVLITGLLLRLFPIRHPRASGFTVADFCC